ncbi:MAG: DNA topoisomerase IV subunit B [Pseudomonadota bacterium]
MTDLFSQNNLNNNDVPANSNNNKANSEINIKGKKHRLANEYSAEDIEVLEGLEPVRKRPGMYIGGTDENAIHHLISEIFDNAMDEVVAGYANKITVSYNSDHSVTIADNGRGIPVDDHPKFPGKTALEVILTTLHSGAKFSNKSYDTAGGLHGVGISVVNALSSYLKVEIYRDGHYWWQEYSRGVANSNITKVVSKDNKKGTSINFIPDDQIFDKNVTFKAAKIYSLIRAKAYLFKGVKIHWQCDKSFLQSNSDIPAKDVIYFPNGLSDFLADKLSGIETISNIAFVGQKDFPDEKGKVEWAINWGHEPFIRSFCNTIPTPVGGTHEAGLKSALFKSIKAYGEMIGNKKIAKLTSEDVIGGAYIILSIFIKEPQFQGQTKEKLVSQHASKLVENAIKDIMDHWLIANKDNSNLLIEYFISRQEERLSKKQKQNISRKSFISKLRLPGKLADCTQEAAVNTEIFLVEGDSAGGSAKMARNRHTQAILPLRGKVLNVASATKDKINANKELSDLVIALGCGSGKEYKHENLRYEKVIIMTDADVDGSHIASLLMTFFYCRMPELVKKQNLYLARPPLFRIKAGDQSFYAIDEDEKDKIIAGLKNKNVTISRFKGLGEMTPAQLKETTMNQEKRILQQITINDDYKVKICVDNLMGKKPETRFKFIEERSMQLSAVMQDMFDD